MLFSGPGLAGLAIAAALAFGGVQTWRLKGCQADAAQQKAQVAILGASLAEQNRAVEAIAKEGAAKAAAAAQALREAEGKAKVWEDDSARWRRVLAARKPTDPQDCKAAWQELRK